MSFRPLPILTVFTLASLAILLWLGNWQYGRFTGKLALEGVEPTWEKLADPELLTPEVLIYSFTAGESAWRRVVPVRSGDEILFVTREIIYSIDPPVICEGACDALAPPTREGVFLTPKGRSTFTAQDQPEKSIYYAYDVGVLSALIPEDTRALVSGRVFEPRTVALTERTISRPGKNPFARLGTGDELPPQRHFGYALTWWGLAFALLVIYFVFHHSHERLRFRSK